MINLQLSFAPEVVHVNCFGPGMFFYTETAKAYSAPLLMTFHSDNYTVTGPQTLMQRLMHMADWITAPSASTLQYARRLAPAITSSSSVIYNGVQASPVVPSPLSFDRPHLLCLGRLAPEKGFRSALQAFGSLITRFPSAHLTIAGGGPERTALEEQVKCLGLCQSVTFHGWIPPQEVPALINTASLVVMPSYREGLPLVAIEAALMGRPVVATLVGGLPEVVVHQKTGLLVQKDDVHALSEAISFLLSHPAESVRMGEAARSRSLEVFSLERCVDSYEALYSKLVNKERHAQQTSTVTTQDSAV